MIISSQLKFIKIYVKENSFTDWLIHQHPEKTIMHRVMHIKYRFFCLSKAETFPLEIY